MTEKQQRRDCEPVNPDLRAQRRQVFKAPRKKKGLRLASISSNPVSSPESHRQQKTVTPSVVVRCVTFLLLQPPTPSGTAIEALHLLTANQTELRGIEQRLSQKGFLNAHAQPLYAMCLQGASTFSTACLRTAVSSGGEVCALKA